ncbi:MFS transporter [Deminuibacter soli]|uniref:MFS transporter n=1 Tax=Deminuibacter soli TaxID=2291815 RepID=A0A3E1NKF1_9BACT|nr:MFS transporter [Deminuibacter soli]RFM28258.1 MFS transporter [Deminuibacter soli]
MPVPLDRLRIFSIRGVQMRTFHLAWLMFFTCFFGWFGLAPLMPTIRADLGLSKSQVGNTIIASVTATIVARLVAGRLCDTIGPRKTAVWLLVLGAIPVMGVSLAWDYTSFLLFRLAIGVIGASFVITQFHTAVMFAPQIKGTANAVAGGWGNLGGGVTNIVMPLVFSAILACGYTAGEAWRYAMLLPGVLLLAVAWLYWKYTKDTPAGNYSETGHAANKQPLQWAVLADWRIWALTLAYAMCFGMEITFDNVAVLHFVDSFELSQNTAGLWAGAFGLMNVFARALGGIWSDKAGLRAGLRGKGIFLAVLLLLEGAGLLLFAHAGSLTAAVICMLSFALFLKMANGATYGIVPFINPHHTGLVSGVVGAGGNVGGMVFGFLFKSESLTYTDAFVYIGCMVIVAAVIVAFTRFQQKEREIHSSRKAQNTLNF